MLILCATHGPKPAILVSPDLADAMARITPIVPYIRIEYRFESQAAHSLIVSTVFARHHQLSEGVFDLPDQYPTWVDELIAVCGECMQNALQQG